MQQRRQLAAILFTDIVGYTALMQRDEQQAVAIVKKYTRGLKDKISAYSGEILNDYGDGSLCIFSSATDAVQAALDLQQELKIEPVVPLRIGLHIGEVLFEDGKVFGDAVNVASRIQSLGQANCILFSGEINNKIKNQLSFTSTSLGKFEFKNVDEPIEVFALCNKGLTVPKREEMSGKLKETSKKNSNRKIFALAGIVLALVLSFLVYKFFLDKNNAWNGTKSIAVLPFENEGMAVNDEFVSDGITQDIINSLSKIASLKTVISWASVRSYKNKKPEKTIRDIADELGVASVLTGTIQRMEGNIRIDASLVDAATGKNIWSDKFIRSWKDFLQLQGDVSEKIVRALNASLTPVEQKNISKKYTENIEAYRFYRKGRAFWDARTTESFDSAEANYIKAKDLDPDYALAYSGLADCYIFNLKGLSQREAIPIAKDYAYKALSLDSTLPEAITTIGWIEGAFDYDWKKSKALLQKALALDPNYSIAHMFYGNLLYYTGESTEEGINEIKQALRLDPLSVSINWVFGRNLYFAKKYDSANIILKKTLALNPKYFAAAGTLSLMLSDQKKFSEAFKIIKTIPPAGTTLLFDHQEEFLGYTYAMQGDSIQAKKIIEEITNGSKIEIPYRLARIYTALKKYDEAIKQLERAYDIRDIHMYHIYVDATLDPLRNEPRFKSLLRKMNLL